VRITGTGYFTRHQQKLRQRCKQQNLIVYNPTTSCRPQHPASQSYQTSGLVTCLGLEKMVQHKQQIANNVGCKQNMVSRILHRYNPNSFTTHHKQSGPQRKTNKYDDRRIVDDAIQHRRRTLADITNNSRLNILKSTIVRHLHEHGFHSYIAVQKPWLDDEHRKA